ncbi:MAG: SdpI family protein [Pseudonocardia sp.]|nr:SdpI family protein [Pseudonocardia sp.]
MPVTVRLVVGSLLVLAGLALIVVAVLGARSVLRRNRWVGVRTAATLSSETQFVAGNRAAAAPVGAAGVVAAVGGTFLLVSGDAVLDGVVLTISLLGVLGLTVVGGLVGDRAAGLTSEPSPFAASCGGTCAGCDLVAGCRSAQPET